MKLMKNMTAATVILSLVNVQFAIANASMGTVDQAIKNYRASVESGVETDDVASKELVQNLVAAKVNAGDISAWVANNSTPENFQNFEKAYSYATAQANSSSMSDDQIRDVLTNAIVATGQEGVHWKSCGTKYAIESILFVAAGVMGILSLCYLHMDQGQDGNIKQASADNATTKSTALANYNAAPAALNASQQDQANITADQLQIGSLQTQISTSQGAALAALNGRLATTEAQLSKDQSSYNADLNAYNVDVATYSSTWLALQNEAADAKLQASDAQYLQNESHDSSVSKMTGILAGVLGAAGTGTVFMHCGQ